jgi:hypothetical protein
MNKHGVLHQCIGSRERTRRLAAMRADFVVVLRETWRLDYWGCADVVGISRPTAIMAYRKWRAPA